MDKKQRHIERGVALATEATEFYKELSDHIGDYFANGYDASGDDEIEDGPTFTGVSEADPPVVLANTENIKHLNAAKYTALINALSALKTTFEGGGNLTALRKAEFGG